MKRLGGIAILAAVSLGCVLAGAGCASGGSAAGPTAARRVSTPSSVLQYQLPLAAYQLTPLQSAQENYLAQRLEQLCLGRLGFRFLPGLSEKFVAQSVRITDEFETRLYGVSDPVAVRTYGYHLPSWVQGSAKPEGAAQLGTAEHDITCKLRVNVLGVEFAVVSRYQDQAIAARAVAFAQAKKIIASEALGLGRLMASVPS